MPINFAELSLSSISYEIRYENAYLIWDRAGAVANSLLRAYPKLKNTQASPGTITFSVGRNLAVVISLDKAVVSGFRVSKELDQFGELAQVTTEAVVEHLGVAVLSRIGLRPAFVKPLPSKEAAGAAVIASGLVKTTDKKLFNVDASSGLVSADYGYRREGPALGFSLRVVPMAQKVEFQGNVDLDPADVPDVNLEKYTLAVDVDYFTTAPTPVGVFKPAEWISQALHTINRDARILLGEA